MQSNKGGFNGLKKNAGRPFDREDIYELKVLKGRKE